MTVYMIMIRVCVFSNTFNNISVLLSFIGGENKSTLINDLLQISEKFNHSLYQVKFTTGLTRTHNISGDRQR